MCRHQRARGQSGQPCGVTRFLSCLICWSKGSVDSACHASMLLRITGVVKRMPENGPIACKTPTRPVCDARHHRRQSRACSTVAHATPRQCDEGRVDDEATTAHTEVVGQRQTPALPVQTGAWQGTQHTSSTCTVHSKQANSQGAGNPAGLWPTTGMTGQNQEGIVSYHQIRAILGMLLWSCC